jgi:hypothetical protein
MAFVLSLFSRLSATVTTFSLNQSHGLDDRMKHPVKSEFNTAVTEVGVTVTFTPTNSIYSFYRLADANDIARLGPVWLSRVQHGGPADTNGYPSDEVLVLAQRIAKDVGALVWSGQDELKE